MLVIESDVTLREEIRSVARNWQFRVIETFSCLQKTETIIERWKPPVIIADNKTKSMDVRVLIENIKRDGCYCPYIILNSGSQCKQIIEGLLNTDAVFFVDKQTIRAVLTGILAIIQRHHVTERGFQSVGRDVTGEMMLRNALLESEKRDRMHIAHDLHDHIGQMLLVVKLRLEKSMKSIQVASVKKDLEEVYDLLKASMKELSAVSRRMVAGFIKKQPFREALRDLVASICENNELKVRITDEYIPEKMNIEAKTNLYRIIQEALSNTVKHAQATEMHISFLKRNKELRLVFCDNGIGVDLECMSIKTGFRTMKYRVTLLDGEVRFDSKPGKYFKVDIRIPAERVLEE